MTGEANRHAQWESLNGTALVLAAHGDHGDGNSGAWHTRDEYLVVRSGGEREVDTVGALRFVDLGSGRAGQLDVNEVSDEATADELPNYEVGEQHDFAASTQSVVH